MYLRTARLDLDDYNNDTEDGCHITSMAGSWLSVVKGFGGMHIVEGRLHLDPYVPVQWQSYSFRLEFRGRVIRVLATQKGVELILESGEPIEITCHNEVWKLTPSTT
jgi:maltose phosphorylase